MKVCEKTIEHGRLIVEIVRKQVWRETFWNLLSKQLCDAILSIIVMNHCIYVSLSWMEAINGFRTLESHWKWICYLFC